MTTQCSECGAPLTSDEGCTQRFYHFLALEFADPEYGSVHHLTVGAYMLQHPSQLSRMGWQAMRDLLTQFLADEKLTPARVRARNRTAVDNKNRSWSFTKGERLQLPDGFSWTQTILSVDDSTATNYRTSIERWARQVLEDVASI